MRIRLQPCLVALAALAFAMPVWARSESQTLQINQPATIGTKTLKPGNYRFVVNPDQNDVRIMREGKLVAQVPGKWVTLKNKSTYTAVIFNKHQIQELEFSGKVRALKVS